MTYSWKAANVVLQAPLSLELSVVPGIAVPGACHGPAWKLQPAPCCRGLCPRIWRLCPARCLCQQSLQASLQRWWRTTSTSCTLEACGGPTAARWMTTSAPPGVRQATSASASIEWSHQSVTTQPECPAPRCMTPHSRCGAMQRPGVCCRQCGAGPFVWAESRGLAHPSATPLHILLSLSDHTKHLCSLMLPDVLRWSVTCGMQGQQSGQAEHPTSSGDELVGHPPRQPVQNAALRHCHSKEI